MSWELFGGVPNLPRLFQNWLRDLTQYQTRILVGKEKKKQKKFVRETRIQGTYFATLVSAGFLSERLGFQTWVATVFVVTKRYAFLEKWWTPLIATDANVIIGNVSFVVRLTRCFGVYILGRNGWFRVRCLITQTSCHQLHTVWIQIQKFKFFDKQSLYIDTVQLQSESPA